MTINEALALIKSLRDRHSELTMLQNQCGRKQTHYYGENPVVNEPTYDVKDLDKKINRLAREIRKLDSAVKATNAIVEVQGYTEPDETIWDGPS